MTHIDLQTDKAQIIQELLMIDDENAIKSIKRYISSHRVKKQTNLSPAALTKQELKELLLDQRANPTYVSHEEVLKQFAQWQ